MLGEVLSADRGHRGPGVPCGNGHEAVFAGYRDKSFDTALGLVTVTRAWYHCAECGRGLAPRDAELGVTGTSMSPGLAAMNDLAAAAGPFAGAARLLDRAPARPRPQAEVHAAGPERRMARRPPGRPRLGLHRRHHLRRRGIPARRRQEGRDRHRPRLLREQRPPHALPLVPQCGLFVGSGVVESSCKTVIGQRLKQSGMHWTLSGADAIIALRCREASSQWEAVCNTRDTQARTA